MGCEVGRLLIVDVGGVKTSEVLELLGSPVGEEVVAHGGGSGLVSVVLFDDGVAGSEELHAGVEFLEGGVGLSVLGEVLHELELVDVDGGGDTKGGDGGE